MSGKGLSFSECAIIRRDLVFISAQVDELTERGVDHTKVIRWKGGDCAHFMIDWGAPSISATAAPLTLLSMGVEGEIHVFQGSQRWREVIPGACQVGPLRAIRSIDGSHYAAGMQRQLYKREEGGEWVSIADAIRNQEGVKGFNSVDGYAGTELYAAGLDGELWLYDGRRWQRQDSTVAVALQAVHCSEDGTTYVVGQGGSLLKGRGNRWRRIDLGVFTEDLWGVQSFNGQLFVATSRAVYRVQGGTLKEASIGSSGLGSASFLAAADGVLWSVGQRHLAFTRDGESWVAVGYSDVTY